MIKLTIDASQVGEEVLPTIAIRKYRSTFNNEVNMISAELQEIADRVLTARGYVDVFGMPAVNVAPEKHARQRFRVLQKDLHPDRYMDDDAKHD